MRFLKILGMVVALHVVLFTIFLLSPGCQSNPTTQAPAAAAPEPEASTTSSLAPSPVDENWSSQPTTNSVSNTISSAPMPAFDGDGVRAAPARPSNPDSYVSTGDRPPPALNPPPTTHIVRAGDNIAKIAAKYGTTTSAVLRANPGVKPQSLRIGQEIKLPASISAPAGGRDSAPAASAPVSGARYTVRAGDTLSAIAARNGTTVTALRQANNLRGDTIQVGQDLVIPGGSGSSSNSSSGYTPAPAAPRPGAISGDASRATVEHTLRSGETLGALSKRYGVSVEAIMSANNIADARRIRAGQKLVIPGAAAAPAPAQRREQQPSATPQPAAPAPSGESIPEAEALPEQPLIPADMTDAPPIPVDEPTPTP